MNSIAIETQTRTAEGKKSTGDLRKSGWIPCNLYGGSENIQFAATLKSLRPVVYTPDFNMASMNLDGKEHKAILKELQFDPVTDALVHVDFMEMVEGKTIIVDLPVKIQGSPVGTRAGGKLYLKSRLLKVKTKPEFLISHLDVDVSKMELGDTIRVSDLKYDNMEILTPGNIPVTAVTVPRLMKEEVVAPVAAAAPVEGAAAAAPGAPAAAAPAADAAKKEEKKK